MDAAVAVRCTRKVARWMLSHVETPLEPNLIENGGNVGEPELWTAEFFRAEAAECLDGPPSCSSVERGSDAPLQSAESGRVPRHPLGQLDTPYI